MKYLANTDITAVREKALIVVAPFVAPQVLGTEGEMVLGTDPLVEPVVISELTIVELVAFTLPPVAKSSVNVVVSTYARNVANAVLALVLLYVSKVKLTEADPRRAKLLSVTSVSPEHLPVPAYPHTIPAALAMTV